jgi:ribosome recycling factor
MSKILKLVYFDTVWAKNVAHINIGTEENPFYLPQEMFTDEYREHLIKYFKKEINDDSRIQIHRSRKRTN